MNQLNSNDDNISTFALPKIHVALRILPLASEDQPQNIIKISENEALLTTPSKSYVFEFDNIITEPSNYLYDTLPHAIINDLLLGQNPTLFIYDSTQLQNGVDLKMITSLSYRLFTLKGSNSNIHVQYMELAENNTTYRDLLSTHPQYLPISQSISKYEINQVQDIENYYKLGSEKQESHCVSIFALTLVEGAKIATFYIVNISGVDYTTRDIMTHHWLQHINQNHEKEHDMKGDNIYNLFIRSRNIYFVTAIQPNHERHTENIIHHASTIYSFAKKRDPQHIKDEAIQRFEQWMSKLTNNNSNSNENISQKHPYRGSINTAINTSSSSSSSEYDRHRHASMFSAISNSTSLTIPESITEEKDHLILADLYRQIEELQNQVTMTRERNMHVEKELQELRSLSSLSIHYPHSEVSHSDSTIDSYQQIHADMEKLLVVEEKQSMLINGLESKLVQTESLNKNLKQQLDLLEKEKDILEENVEKQIKWMMTEVESLSLKKDELQLLSSAIDQRLDSQEYKNIQHVEEIAQLKTRYQTQEKENIKKNRFIESVAYQLLTTTTSESDGESSNSINENRFEELNKCIKELVIQRNRYFEQLKESRDEYEKLQHTFTMRCAKAGLIEKKSQNLASELDSVRRILREKDTSGMIRKLEEKITTMELEKEHIQSDFESSYESALNEIQSIQKKADDHTLTIQSLERTMIGLHEQLTNSSAALIQKDEEMHMLMDSNQRLLKINEQLKKQIQFNLFENQKLDVSTTESDKPTRMRRSRSSAPVKPSTTSYSKGLGEKKPSRFLENHNQLIKWYKQKTESPFGKIEIADRLLKMSEENYQLKAYVDELEGKVVAHKQESSKEIRSLENEIVALTKVNACLKVEPTASPPETRNNSLVRTSSGNMLQNFGLPTPPARHPLRQDSLSSSGLYDNSDNKSSYHPLNNVGLERNTSIPPSPPFDISNSRHNSYLTVRSTASSVHPPPPSDPPTNPLPPVPSNTEYSNSLLTPENLQDAYRTSTQMMMMMEREGRFSVHSTCSSQPLEQYETVVRGFRNKIHMLESDIRIHQQVISKLETQLLTSETKVQEQRHEIGQLIEESQAMDRTTMGLKTDMTLINDQLNRERERKQTAEQQCQVLSKRLDNVLNKKSKFRCF